MPNAASNKRVGLAILVVASLALVALVPLAAAEDKSVDENVTAMKNGIVSTLATWIPFVILFTLLGLALAALGINWGGLMARYR